MVNTDITHLHKTQQQWTGWKGWVTSKKKDKDRREGKGCRCWLGGALTIYQQGWFEQNLSVEHQFYVGWWFSVVWTRWSSVFPKHPFRQIAVILFILFFKSSWWKIAIAARKTAATTFVLSYTVSLFFFYVGDPPDGLAGFVPGGPDTWPAGWSTPHHTWHCTKIYTHTSSVRI